VADTEFMTHYDLHSDIAAVRPF